MANTIKIDIKATDKNATKTINKLDSAIEDAGVSSKGLNTSFAKMAAGFASGQAIFAAGNKILNSTVDYLLDSVAAATDAEETFSKFAAVFDTIPQSSQAAAEAIAEDFGLADSTAQRLLSSTGDLLSGFGFLDSEALNISDTVNRLAIDLASFQNIQGGAEAASSALTKALLGETESAKSLGIVIRAADVEARLAEKGMRGLTGTAKLQAEAQERLNIAMEQSKNAIGDYERTADSAANVNKRFAENAIKLQEAIGSALLDKVTPLKEAFSELFGAIAENVEGANILGKAQDAYDNYRKNGVVTFQDIEAQIQIANEAIEKQKEKIKDADDTSGGMYEASERIVSAAEEELKLRIQIRNSLVNSLRYAGLSAEATEAQAAKEEALNKLLKANAEARKDTAETTKSIQEQNEAYTNSQMSDLEKLDSEYDSVYANYWNSLNEIADQIVDNQSGAEKDRLRVVRDSLIKEFNEYKSNLEERKQAAIDAESEKQAEIARIAAAEAAEKQSIYEQWQATKYEIDAEIKAAEAEKAAFIESKDQETTAKQIERQKAVRAAYQQTASNVISTALAVTNAILDGYKAQAAAEEATNGKVSKETEEAAKKAFAVNKALSIAQIAVNTATAMMGAMAATPGVAGIALASSIGALGAVQAGIAASQELSLRRGGEFDVPSGYSNDSYPLRVESGEHVKVTPVGKSSSDGNTTIVNTYGSVWTAGDLANKVSSINQSVNAGF